MDFARTSLLATVGMSVACTREPAPAPPTPAPTTLASAPHASPARGAVEASGTAGPGTAAAVAVDPSRSVSTGPVASAEDAVRRAIPAANAALDAAYARSRPSAPRKRPWVDESGARTSGDAENGFTVTWSNHPPAGFEFDAVVTVAPSGAVVVTKASATFASD